MRRLSAQRLSRILLWLGTLVVAVWLLRQTWQALSQANESQAHEEWSGIGINSSISTGFQGQLVKIVHQSWVNKKLPHLFARWSQSFPKCFPDFQYKLWTDEDNRQLIARYYPWFLPRFDSYGAGVQKADVSRLFYMYHFGGLYCDLDCECLRNFEHLLANTSLAFGAMSGTLIPSPTDPLYVSDGQIENSFMYSRPRHPFIWDLIMRLNSTTSGMPIMSSGPYLIMSGIHSARKLGLEQRKVDSRPYFTVYPPNYFNPFSWINYSGGKCNLFGKFTDEQLKKCRDSFPDSYVIQYHTQVWDKGKNLANQF